jgi:aminodeoxyfutalosine deaminase
VTSLKAHPVRRYVDAGLLVTVNSDDPKMFGNSLAEEYAALETVLGMPREVVTDVLRNGARASWLSGPEKVSLLAQMDSALSESGEG